MAAKNKDKELVVLLDVHAILHRSYHALPDFSTKSGEPTGGLYGTVALLFKIYNDLKPNHIIACYDLPKPTFRDKLFDKYKAGRPKADDELISQLKRSRDLFEALSIPVYDHEGFEADDIIGTITEKLSHRKDVDVIIASGDMDTLQLVSSKKVRVYTLKKGINDTIIYDEDGVKERFGFGPELLPDYKGLRGDPSDNIPGIQGIGEKTATELITNFGSIQNIYKTLKKDEGAFKKAGIKERIVNLLKENEEEAEFSRVLGTIRRDAPIDFVLPEHHMSERVDMAKIEKLFTELEFRTLLAKARTMFATGSTMAASGVEVPVDESSADFKEAAIALWLLDSNITRPTGENVLSYTHAADLPAAKEVLEKELKEGKLWEVYRQIELPIVSIIDTAEKLGIRIDKSYLANLSEKYHKKLLAIEKKIWEMAGHEFNISSPKQLGEILFDEMNLAVKGLRKTEGGARSTRESELIKMKDAHPIIEEILNFREVSKLLTTYIDPLPLLADENERVHTHLRQTGTTTGRMSSDNPNLQNIPNRGDYGKEVRDAFVASAGYDLVSFDYSQIEMRILAALSKDKNLIEVFEQGKDIHTSVAARVFGVGEGEVTKEMRRKAKVINFGIIYGMGVSALKTNLGVTQKEAKEFHDSYFIAFPSIKQYFDSTIIEAAKKGYTETEYGRRRYLPDLRSKIQFVRAAAERAAMNAPLQGTAADLIKLAMSKCYESLKQENLLDEARLLLQVHDELLFEVKKDSLSEVAIEIIKKAMEGAAAIKVPTPVHVSRGHRWGSIKEA